MNLEQERAILELLWPYMKKDPNHKDRVQTGWGTKTAQGLVATLGSIFEERYERGLDDGSASQF